MSNSIKEEKSPAIAKNAEANIIGNQPGNIITEMAAYRARNMLRFAHFHHMKFELVTLNCAPEETHCPDCDAVVRRRQEVKRGPIIDVCLEGLRILIVTQGVYACRSKKCRRKVDGGTKPRYFRMPLPFTVKYGHYTVRARRMGIDGVKIDGMPFTGVVKRLMRELYINPARSTVWTWHKQEGDLASVEYDFRPWTQESLSGVVCIDELYDGEFCLLMATDPLADLTIGFQLLNEKEVDAEKVSEFMEYLSTIGVRPEVVITDDSALYPAALKKTWPEVLHQLCVFHFIRHLVNDVVASVRSYVKSMPKDPKRRRGRPCKRGRPRSHHNGSRKKVYDSRFLLVKNPGNLSDEEKESIEKLLKEHPGLQPARQFMEKVYELFDPKVTIEEAKKKRLEILSDSRFQADKHLSIAVERLRDDEKFKKLTLFLEFENLDRTSNHVERENRRFRKKQKSHYRLREFETIRNALNMKLKMERESHVADASPAPRLRKRVAKEPLDKVA